MYLLFKFIMASPVNHIPYIMANKRRDFIKLTGLAGLGMATGFPNGLAQNSKTSIGTSYPDKKLKELVDNPISIIGAYGPWAASLRGNELPSLSYRREEWSNVEAWRKAARKRLVCVTMYAIW